LGYNGGGVTFVRELNPKFGIVGIGDGAFNDWVAIIKITWDDSGIKEIETPKSNGDGAGAGENGSSGENGAGRGPGDMAGGGFLKSSESRVHDAFDVHYNSIAKVRGDFLEEGVFSESLGSESRSRFAFGVVIPLKRDDYTRTRSNSD
jgi:hypothetical protein